MTFALNAWIREFRAALVLALMSLALACDGSFAGNAPKVTCDYGDCGGYGAIIWGTIPVGPQQATTWRVNPPTVEMTFFRNGVALPTGDVRLKWNDESRCNLFAGPAEYCATIQEPGGICGPEPIRIEGPDPEFCLSGYILGEDFPLADGDVFRLLVLLEQRPIVDDRFTATYTDRETPDFCENRLGIRCRFARHRFTPLP